MADLRRPVSMSIDCFYRYVLCAQADLWPFPPDLSCLLARRHFALLLRTSFLIDAQTFLSGGCICVSYALSGVRNV
jgi:hypothetical protein